MSFILILNRLDALINRVERLIAASTGVPVEELPPPVEVVAPPPELVITEPKLPNCYKIFSIDLSVGRTDEPIGLSDILKGAGVEYATYMSIISVPSTFSFKVNNTSFDPINAAVGLEWDDFEIKEIFITNAVGTGTALINVEYRVD